MDLIRELGLNPGTCAAAPLSADERQKLQLYINLKLVSSGQPSCGTGETARFVESAHDLLQSYREKNRLLADHLCPVDRRIQAFLNRYLKDLDLDPMPRLPVQSFILDRHGLARELSVPIDSDCFHSDIVASLPRRPGRAAQPGERPPHHRGLLPCRRGRPAHPRRQEGGAQGGLRPPAGHALTPPADLLTLPFTANQAQPARMFVSLLLRPAGLPGGPRLPAGEEHGDPLLRAGQSGQQPGFRGEHLRQRRQPLPGRSTTPPWTSTTGPATPAA